MTVARHLQIRKGEIATYHVWTRCVQRAYLMGWDPYTGRDLSHRREWGESLLEHLAHVFAVDVGDFHFLSNHLHGVVRTRPDRVKEWSDEEAAYRYRCAWPAWKQGRWVAEPTDASVQAILNAGPERVAQVRRRLSSLSWFMGRLKQPLAYLANREMDRRGHHFEARFGCRLIESDADLFGTFLYNDLQQSRAGGAVVEHSRHSAIQRQIRAHRAAEAAASLEAFYDECGSRSGEYKLTLEHLDDLLANVWLSPIGEVHPVQLKVCDPELRKQGKSSVLLPPEYDVGCEFADDDQPLVFSPEKPISKLDLPQAQASPDGEGTEHANSSERGAEHHGERAPDEDPAEEDRVSRGSAAVAGSPDLESGETGCSRPQGRRRRTFTIHQRYAKRMRRRASRRPMLATSWTRYYRVLKQVESRYRLLAAREPQQDRQPPPDAASPLETPSTWRRSVRAFRDWLTQIAAELPELAEELSLARGDPDP